MNVKFSFSFLIMSVFLYQLVSYVTFLQPILSSPLHHEDLVTTLCCLINVGYHLELRVAIKLY